MAVEIIESARPQRRGEAVLRLADIVLINKANSATDAAIQRFFENAELTEHIENFLKNHI